MDNEKIKFIELRIKSLLVSKQLIVGALIVLIGGNVSILFVQNSILKFILFLLGVYYTLILIKDFGNVNEKIEFYLNSYKEK